MLQTVERPFLLNGLLKAALFLFHCHAAHTLILSRYSDDETISHLSVDLSSSLTVWLLQRQAWISGNSMPSVHALLDVAHARGFAAVMATPDAEPAFESLLRDKPGKA